MSEAKIKYQVSSKMKVCRFLQQMCSKISLLSYNSLLRDADLLLSVIYERKNSEKGQEGILGFSFKKLIPN